MTYAKPLALLLALTAATPLWAAHANPWMSEEDEVLMQYHDENLAQSEETEGDDEMLGTMTGTATGKLVLDAGQDDGLGLSQGYSGGGAQGGGKGGAKR